MTWAAFTAAERTVWEAELRACIGLPWRHMGRAGLPYGHQTGLDCVGLLVRAARAVGRTVDDLEHYAREPDGSLQQRLQAHLGPPGAIVPGSIVLIRFRQPQHVGYITQASTVIHAYNGGDRVVVEHPLGLWADRIVAGWRL